MDDAQDRLQAGGQQLWDSLVQDGDPHSLRALIEEACRAKDRLDRLQLITSGDVDTWTRVFTGEGELVLKLDTAVSEQRQLATVFRQLLSEIERRRATNGTGGEGSS